MAIPNGIVDSDGQVTLQLNVTVAAEHYHVLREYLERTAVAVESRLS